jgi:hypothetical protein
VTYLGQTISDLTDLVQRITTKDIPVVFAPCQRELGATSSDPGGNVPCGRSGEFRRDLEFICCERCYSELTR